MALETFGITFTGVRDHHFPQSQQFSTTSSPKAATVTEMIDESAAELAGKLRAQGLTPSSLTLATYPEAYAWCAETVRLSTAIRVFPAVTGGKDEAQLAGWKRRLKDRYADLATHGFRALGDAPEPSQGGTGPATHISYYGLDTGDDAGASSAEPVFRAKDMM